METETIIKSGKYKFRIVDKISTYKDIIYVRNIKIGGNYSDCVNISISYSEDIPISANIPMQVYDAECSLETPLDRGKGSIIMIKEILKYIKQKIPEITSVNFEDLSQIEKYSGMKQKDTRVNHFPLYFFSIMFNGVTWYEKHFNARLNLDTTHTAYRSKVNQLMLMQKPEFIDFLQISSPPLQIMPELQKYYDRHNTYGEFFTSMPVLERCNLVRDWITSFMRYYIGDVFSNDNWIIPIKDNQLLIGGKRKSKRTKNNRFNYSIRRYGLNNDIGVDAIDV